MDALLSFGGFPEPLLAGSDRQAARFRLAYGTRLVREDMRDRSRTLGTEAPVRLGRVSCRKSCNPARHEEDGLPWTR